MAECVICSDYLQGDIASMMCGHVFHVACIKEWMNHKQQCPCCKLSPAQAGKVQKDRRFIKIFLNLEKESLTPLKKIREELDSCGDDDAAKIAELTKGCLLLRQEKQILQAKIDERKTRITGLETHCADLQCQIVEQKNAVTKAALLVNEERKKRTNLWTENQKNQNELNNYRMQLQALHASIEVKDKELSRLRVEHATERCAEHLAQGGELDDFEDFKSCNTEERCHQLTKVLRWREAMNKKTQANEREMQKELQALRTKGRAAKAREQELEKQVSDLKRKCSKAQKERELVLAHAEEQAAKQARAAEDGASHARALSSSSSPPGSDAQESSAERRRSGGEQGEGEEGDEARRSREGEREIEREEARVAKALDRSLNGTDAPRREGGASSARAHAGEREDERERSGGGVTRPALGAAVVKSGGGGGGGRGPVLYGRTPTLGKTGSLIRKGREENVHPSHDPDHPERGGKYIRSGPDGMGGAVNVFMKATEPRPAAAVGGAKRGRPAGGGGGSLLGQGKRAKGGAGPSIASFFSAA